MKGIADLTVWVCLRRKIPCQRTEDQHALDMLRLHFFQIERTALRSHFVYCDGQIDPSRIIAPILSGLLWFELYFHALPCKIKLASLNHGHEAHNHTVAILHRCATRAAALGGLRFNLLVVAAKIFRFF